jgi:hypothetical protein
MFTRFAERELSLPASVFFKGLMGYYGIEYLNLNPQRYIPHRCLRPFLRSLPGIKPHWILFRKFFRVKPQPSASNPRVVGGAGIQIREDAAEQYLSYKLIDSNKTGRRSGSTSRTTIWGCRSRAGSSPSTACGGTRSRPCRRGSSSQSCWHGSRR